MDVGDILYAVYNTESKKFVDKVRKNGSVVERVNPFSSNYFIGREYAEKWLINSGLDRLKYRVEAFIQVKK